MIRGKWMCSLSLYALSEQVLVLISLTSIAKFVCVWIEICCDVCMFLCKGLIYSSLKCISAILLKPILFLLYTNDAVEVMSFPLASKMDNCVRVSLQQALILFREKRDLSCSRSRFRTASESERVRNRKRRNFPLLIFTF